MLLLGLMMMMVISRYVHDADTLSFLIFFPSLYPSDILIQFSPTSYSVAEGGSVQLVVQKIGTADEAVTVTLSTQWGSADSMGIVHVPCLGMVTLMHFLSHRL